MSRMIPVYTLATCASTSTSKRYPMHRYHPLWNRRFSQANRHEDRGPLVAAVHRRSRLMDHAWRCLIDGPDRFRSWQSSSKNAKLCILAPQRLVNASLQMGFHGSSPVTKPIMRLSVPFIGTERYPIMRSGVEACRDVQQCACGRGYLRAADGSSFCTLVDGIVVP
jgi:hypothetical protein